MPFGLRRIARKGIFGSATANQIKKALQNIGKNPQEIYNEILNADGKMYSNDNFRELVKYTPKAKHFKHFENVPLDSLSQPEQITLLLSKISNLEVKISLMTAKENIREKINIYEQLLTDTLKAIDETKKSNFFEGICLAAKSVSASSRVSYSIVHLKKYSSLTVYDGQRFMDKVAAEIKVLFPKSVGFVHEIPSSSKAANVPKMEKFLEGIKKMNSQMITITKHFEKIKNVPSHPDDKFNTTMQVDWSSKKINQKSKFTYYLFHLFFLDFYI
ncbi:hypothetical protein CHUAL_003961 [Chamberlinius hualienensis]